MRHSGAFHPHMQIPVDVEVIIEIMAHKWLLRELGIEQSIEEGDNLAAVHRLIEIRGHRREINPLAQIVVAALFEALQEDGDALIRGRFPFFIDQPP